MYNFCILKILNRDLTIVDRKTLGRDIAEISEIFGQSYMYYELPGRKANRLLKWSKCYCIYYNLLMLFLLLQYVNYEPWIISNIRHLLLMHFYRDAFLLSKRTGFKTSTYLHKTLTPYWFERISKKRSNSCDVSY